MEKFFFNIITISFNDAIGLEKTIKSVIASSGEIKFRYYIIDGGSTDNSCSIINKYSDFIYYSLSEPDGGIFDAMNKGISKIDNDGYVLFLNSGDVFDGNFKIDNLCKWIDIHEYKNHFIYSDNYIGVRDERFLKKISCELTVNKTLPSHQAMILPVDYLKKNLFDVDLKIFADTKMKMHAINNIKTVKYEIPISIFFLGGASNNWNSYSSFLNYAFEYFKCYGVTSFYIKFYYMFKGSIKYILLKSLGCDMYYSLMFRIKFFLKGKSV